MNMWNVQIQESSHCKQHNNKNIGNEWKLHIREFDLLLKELKLLRPEVF